jgi:abhydrolase domain-containing protein 17
MSRSPLQKHLIGDLTWKRLGRSLLFIYAFFALYVYFRADSMIFLPQPPSYSDSKEILKIPVTPTETISAIYLPKSQATYTLLYIASNPGASMFSPTTIAATAPATAHRAKPTSIKMLRLPTAI